MKRLKRSVFLLLVAFAGLLVVGISGFWYEKYMENQQVVKGYMHSSSPGEGKCCPDKK